MKANQAIAPAPEARRGRIPLLLPQQLVDRGVRGRGDPPILARTERTVLSMADGYARMHNGKKIGVCCFQQASGSENMFGGVAQVMSDNTPILILPGGNQHRAGHPVRSTPRTTTATPPSGSRASTWWSGCLDDAAAFSQPERPARRSCSRRRWTSPVRRSTRRWWTPTCRPKLPFGGGSGRGRRGGQALLSAERPVLLAGQGTLYAEAWEELRELAELLQVPVAATMNAKGVFPEDHPLSLGTAGAACAGTATAS